MIKFCNLASDKLPNEFIKWIDKLNGEGDGTPFQYSCLENPMDREAWQVAVHGIARSRTQLSDFPFTFHFHALEKEMATHSSVLAWKIPGMEEPVGLLSMESHRVKNDWSDLAEDEHMVRESLCFILIPTTEHLMQKINSKPRFTWWHTW